MSIRLRFWLNLEGLPLGRGNQAASCLGERCIICEMGKRILNVREWREFELEQARMAFKSRLQSHQESRARNSTTSRESQVAFFVQSFQNRHEKLAAASEQDFPDRYGVDWFTTFVGDHAKVYRKAKKDGFAAVKNIFRGRLPSRRDIRAVLGMAQVASAMRDVLVFNDATCDSQLASHDKFLNDLDRLSFLLEPGYRRTYNRCTDLMWDKKDRPSTDWLDVLANREDLLSYFQDLFRKFQDVTGLGSANQEDEMNAESTFESMITQLHEPIWVEPVRDSRSAIDMSSTSGETRFMFIAAGAIFGILLAFIMLWCKLFIYRDGIQLTDISKCHL
jgi:hypothetical protein